MELMYSNMFDTYVYDIWPLLPKSEGARAPLVPTDIRMYLYSSTWIATVQQSSTNIVHHLCICAGAEYVAFHVLLQELGKSKIGIMRECKDFKKGIHLLEWCVCM